MILEDSSLAFKALGDPSRLTILEFLAKCCDKVAVEESGQARRMAGPTVGEVCCNVTGADKITSTVSRHLKELRMAGLIQVQRSGKSMICSVRRETLLQLADYLRDLAENSDASECCPCGENDEQK